MLALAFGLALWEPVAPGVWHDDGAYLLLAESLAEGEGLRYGGVAGFPPGAKFPPVYPVVLSLGWRVSPTGMAEGAGASGLNLVFLAMAAGVTWWLVRRGLGFAPAWAGVAMLPWVGVDLWRLGMVALSEPLFVLLLIACFAALTGALADRARLAPALGLGVLIALLGLTRTVGVLVLPVCLLVLALRGRPKAAIWIAGIALAAWLPWTLWSGGAAARLPDAYQELMGPYGRWLAGQILLDPAAALSRAVTETPALARIVFSLVLPGLGSAFPTLLMVLGPVLCLAALWGLRGLGRPGRAILAFLVLYGIVIWVWPHMERRLVAPVLPLLWLGVPGLLHRTKEGAAGLRAGVRAGVAVWVVLFCVGGVREATSDRHLDAYRIRERMLARAVAAVQGAVPPDGIVGAPELWGGIHLFTGRTVAPSARFLPLSGATWGTPANQYELWAAAGIDHLLLEQGGRVHREALDHLDAECPGSVQLLASWEGGLLVRLAWDAACRARLGV